MSRKQIDSIKEQVVVMMNRLKRKRRQDRVSWKEIQRSSKRNTANGRIFRRFSAVVGLPMLLTLLLYQITDSDANPNGRASMRPEPLTVASAGRNRPIEKADIRQMLDGVHLINLQKQSLDLYHQDRPYRIETSLDVSLQQYLLKNLKRSTSRYIGIVAMDPATGRIRSMIGYDKTDAVNNPCLDNRFPAASVFKIITAAAAIETTGLEADSPLTYNGNKYTLYRSQLKDRKNQWTQKTSLRDSFAESINPVFGKIGARDLGKSTLEKYAEAFGFNRRFGFELPIEPSAFRISDEPYRWAEIASGFNRVTTLSPVHGAMIAAIVLNEGRLIEPTIVENVIDGDGRTIYQGRSETLNQAISSEASEIVHQLMRATVRSGTSKNAFLGHQKDPVLSKLIIGGKTGSINNNARDARIDWFVGFGEEKDGPQKLAVAVVVAHEKYIGIRSSRYARMAIRHFFENFFLQQAAASANDSQPS